MYQNFHSHTHYCDGATKPEAYIKTAIQKGFWAYGYSSHAPLPFSCKWAMDKNKIDSYIAEIQSIKKKYKSQIQVNIALEIDYIPQVTGVSLFRHLPLDYRIGALHFLGVFPDETHCDISTLLGFERGLQQIFGGDAKKAVKRYFQITQEMLEHEPPDILAHMDMIKFHSKNNTLFSEDESWYKMQVFDTLELAKKSGTIIEVNTRGYYKKRTPNLYPSRWVLKRIKELKIPIMVNSDAHKLDEIDAGFEHAYQQIRQVGFTETLVFKNGSRQMQAINK